MNVNNFLIVLIYILRNNFYNLILLNEVYFNFNCFFGLLFKLT